MAHIEVTGDVMAAGADCSLPKDRVVLYAARRATQLLIEPASAPESASGRHIRRIRRVTGENDAFASPLDHRIGHRHCGKEGSGIGMSRPSEQCVGVGELDNAAQVHDRYSISDMPHDREVMCDKKVGDAQSCLKIAEKIDDLRLDRDIEHTHRFVADKQNGLHGKCPGDAHPLKLAARELMGEPTDRRGREANQVEEGTNPRRRDWQPADQKWFPQDIVYGLTGIEARERILEDELELAAYSFEVAPRRHTDINALEADSASGWSLCHHHGASGRRLAGSGLADKAECPARLDREVDPIDRSHDAPAAAEEPSAVLEPHGEVIDLE